MDELAEKFNRDTPKEVLLYLKAFMRFTVVSYSEDKEQCFDFIEYMLNKISSEAEILALDKELIEAHRRVQNGRK